MRALLLMALPLLMAVEIAGVRFADTVEVAGQSLLRNGAGLRDYGPLRLRVYAAALYLPERLSDEQAILDHPGPKQLVMHFFRNGSVEDTRKAWQIYLEANCRADCAWPAAAVERFLALVPETRRGETQTFVWDAQGVAIFRNDTPLGRIDDPAFGRLLLATWIGEEPTTQALKRALLGR